MSLHDDLLGQARQLAAKEPKRPLQASLRRAVSASYYGLFHLFVHDATSRMFPGRDRAALRYCMARAFVHGDMKRVAQQSHTPRFRANPVAALSRSIVYQQFSGKAAGNVHRRLLQSFPGAGRLRVR